MPPDSYQQQMMPPWNMGFQNPYGTRQNQDQMLLQQLSQGYAPVMTMPQQQMLTGFEQLPGFSNPGLLGFGLNMYVAPMLQQQMGRHGMIPGGLSSQNMLDYMQIQQQQQQQYQMLSRIAGDTTQGGVVDFMRGAHEMTGREFGGPQRLAARQMGAMAATAAPLLAQIMPDQLDALSGRRGSAVVMAQRMAETNRFRMDPVTGLMGYDPESTEQEARMLFDEMFSDENMANMRGVRAGEVGGMYRELTRRGMLGADARPSYLRTAEAAESVMAIGGPTQQRVIDALKAGRPEDQQAIAQTPEGNINYDALTTKDWDNLRNQPDVSTQMRAFNADKVKSSLQGYVDVVSTMKEIFGEAGRTDAPMAELIASLEALSQGGLTQVSPHKLNQMVRTTTELAQTSGVTLDAAMMMQQQAAGLLESRGMNRLLATQVTQGGLSFGQGMGRMGSFANPAWGLGDMNENRQLDQNLRVNAIASPLANALGALDIGADIGTGYADNSEALAISKAITAGRSTYFVGGDERNIANLSPQGIRAIMARDAPNISSTEARQLILQSAMNQERIFDKDIGTLVRDDAQTAQVGEQLYERTAYYQARLIRDDQGERVIDKDTAGNIGEAVSAAMQGMTAEERTDPDRRLDILTDAILTGGGDAAGVDRDEARKQARLMWGRMEEQISGKRANPKWAGYGSLQQMMLQQDTAVKGVSRRSRVMASIAATTKNNMAGLTGGTWLGQMVAAVQEAGEDDYREQTAGAAIGDVLGEAAGGVNVKEIRERLEPGIVQLAEQKTLVDGLIEQYKNARPGEQGAIYDQIMEESQVLRSRTNELRNVAEASGLLEQEAFFDIGDITPAVKAAEDEEENRKKFLEGATGAEEVEARFQSLSPAKAAIMRRAVRKSSDLTNEMLDSAVLDPNFLATAGGRGNAAVRSIEAGQREKQRLLPYYGGDSLKQSLGNVDYEGAADKLSALAISEMDVPGLLFDESGQLQARFRGLEGLGGPDAIKREQFRGDSDQAKKIQALLGGARVNERMTNADRNISAGTVVLGSALTLGDKFLLTPSKDVLEQLGMAEIKEDDWTTEELGNAERLQAFRNVQQGSSREIRDQLGMEYLAALASGAMTPKEVAGETGLSEDEVGKLARLGEATLMRGQLGEKGISAIKGINAEQERIKRLEALAPTEDETVKAKRASFRAKYEKTIEGHEKTVQDLLGNDIDVDDFLEGRQELLEFNQENAEDARRITKLDRGSVIGGLARSLGLEDDSRVKELRRIHGSFGQTSEGRRLASLIEGATGAVSKISGRGNLATDAVYTALQQGRDEDDPESILTPKQLAEKFGISERQAQGLSRAGGTLHNMGMLSALGEDGLKKNELMRHIGTQIEGWEKRGLSAEDVRQRELKVTGKVTLEGDQITLSQVTGTYDRAVV